jgi:hypothetical protein
MRLLTSALDFGSPSAARRQRYAMIFLKKTRGYRPWTNRNLLGVSAFKLPTLHG